MICIFIALTTNLLAEQFCTVRNFYAYCGIILKKEYRIDSVRSHYSPLCSHVYIWINTPKRGGGEENCYICALESEKVELNALLPPNTKKKCGKLHRILKKW
jgi:hypothetical protein